MDTHTSCVHYNKKSTLVGTQAVTALKGSVSARLWRVVSSKPIATLSLSVRWGRLRSILVAIWSGRTPQRELSAEVLRKLRSYIQDEPFDSVVITVPAKFTTPQNDATRRAAELAGFHQVYLLQGACGSSYSLWLEQ